MPHSSAEPFPRLNLDWPWVQAPMAGVSTPALAGAVSRAGALGSIAVGAMSADAAESAIAEAMAATEGRLNVNVFVHPRPARCRRTEDAWLESLAPWFEEFGAPLPTALEEIYLPFGDDPAVLEMLLDHRPPVVSFHFGLPPGHAVAALHDAGACLAATATSVAEARALEAAGIDVIVAQGYEAGGHRGAFGDAQDECLPTFTLVPRIVAAVSVPVLAAGGLGTGTDIAAARALGASGVQMGTVFADCPESAAGAAYRHMLHAPERATAMTAAFSGRPARGLINRFIREIGPMEARVPAYPVAYDAAKRLAAAATTAGSSEFTAMLAGTGTPRAAVLPAGDLVRALAEELSATS